ncbi:MAG: ABC transporter substrate-binding protein [Alphaproteobacteria bacterium]
MTFDLSHLGLRLSGTSARWRHMVAAARVAALTFLLSLSPLMQAEVRAQDTATPKATIDNFYATLLGVMKQAKTLGYQGRYSKLEPVVDKTFNLNDMGRLAIGPQWAKLSPDEQARLLDVFRRFTVASYAAQFNGYGGERFEVGNEVPMQQGNLIVESKLIQGNGSPVSMNYLMRRYGDRWQIIDVFIDGTLSEVSRRRSEFTSIIARGGIESLIKVLEQKIQVLQKSA